MTATTQDRPTAQRIATGLVTAGLRAIFTEPVVEAGEEFYAKEVRVPRRGDSIDGLVRFNAVNDGTGEVMAVAVMVHATPLPGVVDRCTVYTSASEVHCGDVAVVPGRCDKHEKAARR